MKDVASSYALIFSINTPLSTCKTGNKVASIAWMRLEGCVNYLIKEATVHRVDGSINLPFFLVVLLSGQ